MEGKSSMTKLEKLPCLVLQYEWKLPEFCKNTVFLSRKMKYQEDDSFQAALKWLSYPGSSLPQLVFTATNLNKMGLKTYSVSFSSDQNNKVEEMGLIQTISDGEEADKNDVAVQLFTSTPKIDLNTGLTASLIIYFTVRLTGIVENYRAYQIDGLLSEQLLSSAIDKAGTDIKLIARDGEHFAAHKFLLAARSPVFADLYSKDGIKSDHTFDCTHDGMIQFVKFIYTGEFYGPFSSGLMKLASKYEIGTFENLCRAASQEISLKEMCSLAMHLQPGSHKSNRSLTVEVTPDTDLKEVERSQTNVSSHKFTWKVTGWTKENEGINPKMDTATSLAPKPGEENPFFVELKAKIFNTHLPSSIFHQFDLKLIVSHGHHNITGSIDEVICSIAIPDNNTILTQPVKMTEKSSHDKKLLQVFYIEDFPTLIACPFVITFNIKLRSSVQNFLNKMIDSNWSQKLWASAVNRKMTDVEILVGEDAFGAHRFLLSARSPVFAAMFASGMKEAESGQVRIEDVDPVTFQHFLKFLYTGMFKPSSIDQELFTVADKYQVETLVELCRPASASQSVDTESIIKTFFSS